MIPQKVTKFLETTKTRYEPIEHRTVYTAFDKATTLKAPAKIVGKTLILAIDKNLAVVLIPANKNLDKNKFKKTAKAKKIDASTGSASTSSSLSLGVEDLSSCRRVDFASEKLIKNRIKGAKVGAIPPFGNLWKLPTFIDKSLTILPKIIINSGDYNWSIKITPAALKKIIPDLTIGSFSQSRSR